MKKLIATAMFTALFSLAGSSTAQAIEVSCENEFGSCTVSNDNGQFMFCECGDEGGGGEVGDDGSEPGPWDGLSEAELLEICLDELTLCEEFAGTDTFGSTTAGPGCGDDGADTGDGGEDTGGGDPTATSGHDDYGEGETGAEDGGGDDGDDEGNISESSTSDGGFDPDLLNCSVGGSSGGALAVLGLGLLGLARRRRRS